MNNREDVGLRSANLTYGYCCFSQKSKMDNEPELKTAEESFRQGWQEALQGETRPVAEIWNDNEGG